MDLLRELDDIFYCKQFDFNGLPEVVVKDIDKLLLTFTKEELMVALIQLKPIYEEKVQKLRDSKPSSGTADQWLMVADMNVLYRQRAFDYLKAKEDGNEK